MYTRADKWDPLPIRDPFMNKWICPESIKIDNYLVLILMIVIHVITHTDDDSDGKVDEDCVEPIPGKIYNDNFFRY